MSLAYDASSVKEILSLANRAFKISFKKAVPKLYTNNDYIKNHITCRENGRLIGTVGCFPDVLYMGGKALPVGGIGTVCVDKKHRGKGIMHKMMSQAVSDAKNSGYALMYLAGRYERYARYGFAKGGEIYNFRLTAGNLKQFEEKGEKYRFERIKSPDDPRIKELERLYRASFLHFERRYFFESLLFRLTAVYLGDRLCGYISAKGLHIYEICTENADIPLMLKAYMKRVKIPLLSVDCAPYSPTAAALSGIAELQRIEHCGNFCVLSAEKTLRFFLTEQERDKGRSYRTVAKFGTENLEIICENGEVTVERSEKVPAHVFEGAEAASALFNPCAAEKYGLPFYIKICVPKGDMV